VKEASAQSDKMWDRKILKAHARHSIKANYWHVLVSILFIYLVANARGLSRMGELSYGRELIRIGKVRVGDIIDFLGNSGGIGITDFLVSMSNSTNGVIATVLNNTSDSGSFIYGIVGAVENLIFNKDISHGIILISAALVMFLFWIFFRNTIQVGKHRFFLETRMYPNTRFGRLFFIYRIKLVRHVAWVMLVKYIFLVLWSLTIVGGFIKVYSYRMVPVILAENPLLSWKDAILMSRKMMDGNKWRAFLLDMSFLGWMILSLPTFGLLLLFYVFPYREAADVELYMKLRKKILTEDKDGGKIFNDRYLTVVPKGKYHAGQVNDESLEYPVPLFCIPDMHSNMLHNLDASRYYSLADLVLLFFSLCFVGKLYEILYAFVSLGEFLNRGTLYGPWIPIYGVGGIVTLILLKRWSSRPLVIFFAASVLCGVIEYTAAWYLETFLQEEWWDYNGYFANIQGRVCLEGLVLFGLMCSLNIYILSPLLSGIYDKIPRNVKILICILMVVLFSIDLVYSLQHPNTAAAMPVH
jgi:uncharacterized membrane protein